VELFTTDPLRGHVEDSLTYLCNARSRIGLFVKKWISFGYMPVFGPIYPRSPSACFLAPMSVSSEQEFPADGQGGSLSLRAVFLGRD